MIALTPITLIAWVAAICISLFLIMFVIFSAIAFVQATRAGRKVKKELFKHIN